MCPEFWVHIKVGDFVFVRILKKLENNKAIISFGGQSFEATIDDKNQLLGKNPTGLINGGFRAKILQRGEAILLQLQDTSETVENQNINKNHFQNLTNQSDIKNYLQNLGLIPDSISFKVIQYIQQMGYSLNLKKLEDIRKIIHQFPGKEQKASEIAMYLEEKGLPVTKESIEELMNKIKGLKDFDNNFLAKNNHSQNKDKYWILIPFQYDVKNISSKGTIFLLKDKKLNSINLINLRLYSEEKSIFFRICLKNQYNQARIKSCRIIFYINPIESESKIEALKMELKKIFSKDKKSLSFVALEEILFSKEAESSIFFSEDFGITTVCTNA